MAEGKMKSEDGKTGLSAAALARLRREAEYSHRYANNMEIEITTLKQLIDAAETVLQILPQPQEKTKHDEYNGHAEPPGS